MPATSITHHVYWRLDSRYSNVRRSTTGPSRNSTTYPPIVGNSNWHMKQFEKFSGQRDLWDTSGNGAKEYREMARRQHRAGLQHERQSELPTVWATFGCCAPCLERSTTAKFRRDRSQNLSQRTLWSVFMVAARVRSRCGCRGVNGRAYVHDARCLRSAPTP